MNTNLEFQKNNFEMESAECESLQAMVLLQQKKYNQASETFLKLSKFYQNKFNYAQDQQFLQNKISSFQLLSADSLRIGNQVEKKLDLYLQSGHTLIGKDINENGDYIAKIINNQEILTQTFLHFCYDPICAVQCAALRGLQMMLFYSSCNLGEQIPEIFLQMLNMKIDGDVSLHSQQLLGFQLNSTFHQLNLTIQSLSEDYLSEICDQGLKYLQNVQTDQEGIGYQLQNLWGIKICVKALSICESKFKINIHQLEIIFNLTQASLVKEQEHLSLSFYYSFEENDDESVIKNYQQFENGQTQECWKLFCHEYLNSLPTSSLSVFQEFLEIRFLNLYDESKQLESEEEFLMIKQYEISLLLDILEIIHQKIKLSITYQRTLSHIQLLILKSNLHGDLFDRFFLCHLAISNKKEELMIQMFDYFSLQLKDNSLTNLEIINFKTCLQQIVIYDIKLPANKLNDTLTFICEWLSGYRGNDTVEIWQILLQRSSDIISKDNLKKIIVTFCNQDEIIENFYGVFNDFILSNSQVLQYVLEICYVDNKVKKNLNLKNYNLRKRKEMSERALNILKFGNSLIKCFNYEQEQELLKLIQIPNFAKTQIEYLASDEIQMKEQCLELFHKIGKLVEEQPDFYNYLLNLVIQITLEAKILDNIFAKVAFHLIRIILVLLNKINDIKKIENINQFIKSVINAQSILKRSPWNQLGLLNASLIGKLAQFQTPLQIQLTSLIENIIENSSEEQIALCLGYYYGLLGEVSNDAYQLQMNLSSLCSKGESLQLLYNYVQRKEEKFKEKFINIIQLPNNIERVIDDDMGQDQILFTDENLKSVGLTQEQNDQNLAIMQVDEVGDLPKEIYLNEIMQQELNKQKKKQQRTQQNSKDSSGSKSSKAINNKNEKEKENQQVKSNFYKNKVGDKYPKQKPQKKKILKQQISNQLQPDYLSILLKEINAQNRQKSTQKAKKLKQLYQTNQNQYSPDKVYRSPMHVVKPKSLSDKKRQSPKKKKSKKQVLNTTIQNQKEIQKASGSHPLDNLLAQLKSGGKEIVEIKQDNQSDDKLNRLMNIYGPKRKESKTDQTLVIDREWLEQEMINNDETEPFEIEL